MSSSQGLGILDKKPVSRVLPDPHKGGHYMLPPGNM